MKDSGSLILQKARWYLILVAIVVEFFIGEAAYGIEDGLRHLRKWRFAIACLPIVSLAMLVCAATQWPKQHEDSTSYYEGQILRDRATKLESKVENLMEEQDRQRRLMETQVAAMVAVQINLTSINQKFDLLGWLVGASIVAMLGASAMYFYNVKLRREMAQADIINQRKRERDDYTEE